MTGAGVAPCTVCHAPAGVKCDPVVHADRLREREEARIPTLGQATRDFTTAQTGLNHTLVRSITKLNRDIRWQRVSIWALLIITSVHTGLLWFR